MLLIVSCYQQVSPWCNAPSRNAHLHTTIIVLPYTAHTPRSSSPPSSFTTYTCTVVGSPYRTCMPWYVQNAPCAHRQPVCSFPAAGRSRMRVTQGARLYTRRKFGPRPRSVPCALGVQTRGEPVLFAGSFAAEPEPTKPTETPNMSLF